ncbi:DgyrCDS11962 [Dimorphilus gyrociliatus]|nr:DgyrCDS11962 [Dimorphilus gyrociliatus]
MGDDEQRHRVVFMGAGRVGKTSIIRRFLQNSFSNAYRETIEDLHCKDYNIQGTSVKVDFLDTSGDLAFPAMRRLSISTAHAFVLVYSVDDDRSFDTARSIRQQIKEQRSNYEALPCVVVANKIDLGPNRQKVSTAHVDSWLNEEGMTNSFVDVSAKTGTNIQQIFHKLLEQADIPEVKKLEPILRRRLSANSASLASMRERLRVQESSPKGFQRSRSLIRRSKPKVKESRDPTSSDCVIS